MEEVWRDIKGYEGLYQVSSLGNVKSLNYNRTKKEKVLKFGKDKGGYYFVVLYLNKKAKTIIAHRLVAIAFLENPENKPQVNHLNGKKLDNRVENLEWSSRSENMRHAFDTGLSEGKKGEKHGRSKLTESQVIKIRELYSTRSYSQKEIALMLNVSQSQIGRIVNHKTWSHI
ncbi:MAG: endonuclease [Pelagibacterales bacterium]|nr:endonuclease [Pelagibacterales bacterium]